MYSIDTSGATLMEAQMQAAQQAMDRLFLGDPPTREPASDPHQQSQSELDLVSWSMRPTLREQSLEWMAANPGKGRPCFQVQSKNVLYHDDPLNSADDPYVGPPKFLTNMAVINHSNWTDVLIEMKTDFGADVLRTRPQIVHMAAFATALSNTGLTEEQVTSRVAKKFGRHCLDLPRVRNGSAKVASRVPSITYDSGKFSTKSLKAAAKKEARLKKKGGETEVDRFKREQADVVSCARNLQADIAYNLRAREHNRQLAQVRSMATHVLDIGDAPPFPTRSRVNRDSAHHQSPDEPRVVTPTAEDKARSRFRSWARQLGKRDRQSRFSTAFSVFESEKRKEMRAACDAEAAAKAAKAAAALAALKAGPSGPSKAAAWTEEAAGESDRCKANGMRAISLEKSSAHQQSLEDKERLRLAQVEEQKEARRKAFEIGGSLS
jgi:hypothetical protein